MLGFILTSVFFFFAMRQRAAIAAQRDTMAILNTKAYLESFAEYLEKLDPKVEAEKAALEGFKKNGVNYDGITGTVTNNPTEIIGTADFKENPADTYTFDEAGEIYIEWNKCAVNMGGYGDMYFDKTLYSTSGTGCADEKTYNDITESIIVKASKPFTIKTSGIPFYYRIVAKNDSTKLIDGKWYMDLSIDLVNGKKYTIKKGF